MTQPISGFRRTEDPWSGVDPPVTSSQPEGRPALPAPAPPPPPASRASSPGALVRGGVRSAAPTGPAAQAARDADVQRRLDAFRLSLTAPVRTRQGFVQPGVPFRMSTPYAAQRLSIERNVASLARAAVRGQVSTAGLGRVLAGRGSPRDIQAITQALVDAGPDLPASGLERDLAVREMMFNHGVGLDCAGYVQQAYLSVTGLDRTRAGFGSPLNEDLSNLGARGFSRVTEPSAIRPGDIFVLGPPLSDATAPGHRVIVYSQHVASDADTAKLVAQDPGAGTFVQGAPLRVIEVDSSWGGGGRAQEGGVQRQTWWYAEGTRKWGWLVPGSRTDDTAPPRALFGSGSTPYAHTFDGSSYGVFRGRTGQP